MIKIITIIGARPQIIKASAISRAIKENYKDDIEEIIVHTGQHYDKNMSEVFFTELDIPRPKYNLAVGSGKHGEQTSKMIEGIENILETEKPNGIILYGDTNSTLAGAIAASKIHVPIVHIEAGLRSFDKYMPEEINRIMCDHASTLLFSPTKAGYNNLIREGFSTEINEKPCMNKPNIYHSGDIMYDNTLHFSKLIKDRETSLSRFGKDFILCTIHRNTNTDDATRLLPIFKAIVEISKTQKIILPLHPRTKKMMPVTLGESFANEIENNSNIEIIEPVSFLDMIYLETNSKLILTDSGGVQKEAYYLEKPCVILRPQTEWVEIVECGNAAIADADYDAIVSTVKNYIKTPPKAYPNIFGDGQAAKFMCGVMLKCL